MGSCIFLDKYYREVVNIRKAKKIDVLCRFLLYFTPWREHKISQVILYRKGNQQVLALWAGI